MTAKTFVRFLPVLLLVAVLIMSTVASQFLLTDMERQENLQKTESLAGPGGGLGNG